MTALAKIHEENQKFSGEQIELIRRTICKGATDDELKLFMYQAESTGLNPLARQIYAVKRWDSMAGREVMSIQTSIDGFRLIAERSGKYAGQVGPYWCGPDGEWKDVWIGPEPPTAARVGALRSDFKEPCWGVARYDSYAQKKKDGSATKSWQSMADVMIAKCAEALALRKAFPQELSGLYTSDEMAQISSIAEEPAERSEKTNPPPPKKLREPESGPYQPPVVEAEPTEQERIQPHKLIIPQYQDGSPDYQTFITELVSFIKVAADKAEVFGWVEANKPNIDRTKRALPTWHTRFENVVKEATQ